MISWKASGLPSCVILLKASLSPLVCSTGASQWPKSIFEREFALTIHGPLPMSSLNPLLHFTHRLITSPSLLKMIFQSRQKRKAYVKSLKRFWRIVFLSLERHCFCERERQREILLLYNGYYRGFYYLLYIFFVNCIL